MMISPARSSMKLGNCAKKSDDNNNNKKKLNKCSQQYLILIFPVCVWIFLLNSYFHAIKPSARFFLPSWICLHQLCQSNIHANVLGRKIDCDALIFISESKRGQVTITKLILLNCWSYSCHHGLWMESHGFKNACFFRKRAPSPLFLPLLCPFHFISIPYSCHEASHITSGGSNSSMAWL